MIPSCLKEEIIMSSQRKAEAVASENIVTTETSRLSDLWKKEDWLAVWIGFIIIAISAVAVLTGAFDFNAAKFSTWGHGTSFFEQVNAGFFGKLLLTVAVLGVLFSNIVNFGLYGLGIAWIVTPIVILFMWWFGTRVLKIDNKPFVITLATATSVCGTSAAIAVGAASKAKKNDLSLTVSISIIFTVLMMVFEPVLIRVTGLGELIGGALIGGTVDSTGAVTVAGTALGETAQTAAVLVKSIQNILIGFIAFAVAVFFATKVENNGESSRKIGVSEIWYRLPKFILGFFAASLIASFIAVPAFGKESVSSINSVLDQYKNWAFVLAFTSIGLETNFREIKEQFQGGKPLTLYVVGQLFNIVLTFAAVYLLLSGKFFPLPNLAL